jgi:RNA polymerase sigma factor (sigma-70 family)
MEASSKSSLRAVLKAVELQSLRGLCDPELLERFQAANDEAAFRVIAERHGPMVLGTCRRALVCAQDAEDAFQATFLVFSQRAGSIRKSASLASWLHGVARRVATKLRREQTRRQRRERAAPPLLRRSPADDATWSEVKAGLDEELERLPELYRSVLVLCYLEGQTRDEAAQRLGLKVGEVKGRLERARKLLAERMTKRGLTLSAGLLTLAVSPGAVSAAVDAATLLAAGQPLIAAVAPNVLSLANSILKGTTMAKLKLLGASLACSLTLALGMSFGVAEEHYAAASKPGAVANEVRAIAQEKGEPPTDDVPMNALPGTKVVGTLELPKDFLFRRQANDIGIVGPALRPEGYKGLSVDPDDGRIVKPLEWKDAIDVVVEICSQSNPKQKYVARSKGANYALPDGLPPGSYRADARVILEMDDAAKALTGLLLPDLVSETEFFEIKANDPPRTLNLKLFPAAFSIRLRHDDPARRLPELRGTLTQDGKPVANVQIVLYGGVATRWKIAHSYSNALGRYRFENVQSGTMGLKIEHPALVPAVGKNWRDVKVSPKLGTVQTLDLALTDGGADPKGAANAEGVLLTGQLTLPKGMLFRSYMSLIAQQPTERKPGDQEWTLDKEGYTVRPLLWREVANVELAIKATDGRTFTAAAKVDEEGRFKSAKPLPPGVYQLSARVKLADDNLARRDQEWELHAAPVELRVGPGDGKEKSIDLALAPATVSRRLQLDDPKQRSELKGVATHNGKPVAGVRVLLYSSDDRESKLAEATTDKEGRYRFEVLHGGTLAVKLEHKTLAPADGKDWRDLPLPSSRGVAHALDIVLVPRGQELRRP